MRQLVVQDEGRREHDAPVSNSLAARRSRQRFSLDCCAEPHWRCRQLGSPALAARPRGLGSGRCRRRVSSLCTGEKLCCVTMKNMLSGQASPSHPGAQPWLWQLQTACHSKIWARLMYACNLEAWTAARCSAQRSRTYLAWTGLQACRPAGVSGPRPGCPGEWPHCARQWCPRSTGAPRGSPPTLASPPAACLHMHPASLGVLPILSDHVIVHTMTRTNFYPGPGWSPAATGM